MGHLWNSSDFGAMDQLKQKNRMLHWMKHSSEKKMTAVAIETKSDEQPRLRQHDKFRLFVFFCCYVAVVNQILFFSRERLVEHTGQCSNNLNESHFPTRKMVAHFSQNVDNVIRDWILLLCNNISRASTRFVFFLDLQVNVRTIQLTGRHVNKWHLWPVSFPL